MTIHVKFLCDIARQKLLKLANVSQSYSKNKTGTVFWHTVYIFPAQSSINKDGFPVLV